MPDLQERIDKVRLRLLSAATKCGRSEAAIMLVAVSKTRSADAIRHAANNGLHHFGENYLQEALEKIDTLKSLGLDWHFIGPIQSNKTRQIAENFSWVHSVDRVKIAQRLSDQRPSDMPPLNVCLQINIDNETTKAGLSPDQALLATKNILDLPNIKLRGLMAIPAIRQGQQAQQKPFSKLQQLMDEINRPLDKSEKLDTLSMGMSGDLEAAIFENATIIRVGTDIFGPRSVKQQ